MAQPPHAPWRALLVLAVLLLTACSVPGGPRPIPSLAEADRASAQAAYLALTEPMNAATCTFNATLLAPSAGLGAVLAGAADYAASLRALADGVQATDWPSAIQTDADALVAAASAQALLVEGTATASTMTAFNDAFVHIRDANEETAIAAGRLRADLGLAPGTGNPCNP